ncbi:MAG: DUF2442 domain-containing protein [Burkholderiales bacterium]|nr:DUF2442 domain-containing protein [Burkholderiales bacterium]
MEWDVKQVRALPDYQLQVELLNGRQGHFDLKPFLHLPSLRALRDPDYFSQVGILLGAVTWPDGQDIAPDTLVAKLVETQPLIGAA